VILHADALAQGFMHLQGKRAPQQWLADEQQREIAEESMSKFSRSGSCSRAGGSKWASSQIRMGCCFLL
jgi:hypothetical protein